MSSRRVRERPLVRLFLLRFLEHDLVSPKADRHEMLSAVGGSIVAVSLFLAVLVALQYQFNNFLPPGLTSLRSVDERFLFTSASMLVMALLGVAVWDGLALDARDAAILGVLPLRRSVIVRSKFTAVALLAAGTLVAWNLAPILLRPVSLPLTLPIGMRGLTVLTLSNALVTLSAGAFGFLAVFALREALAALLGQTRFHVISSFAQMVLVVALISALLLLPGASMDVARTWLAPERPARAALPPLWFVGWHETLAGSVIDVLPRTTPARYLVNAEREATRLYRSLWPVFHELGRRALASLAIVIVVTIVACAWNSRRLPAPAVRSRRRRSAAGRMGAWIVTHMVATSSLEQAGFWFTLQTVPRQVTHRAVLAAALAVGVSLMLVAVHGRVLMVQADVAAIPLSVLAAQSLLVASVLTGFRHATQLPANLRAGTTFSLSWTGDLRPYLSGVKRAGLVAVALPILAAAFVWHALVLGVHVAMLHVVTGAALSLLMTETLFLHYRRVPLVSAHIPSADVKSRAPAYVLAILALSYLLAWIERFALSGGRAEYVLFIGALAALAAGVAVLDRVWHSTALALDLDEEPPPPTQRLNLAG